MSALDVPVIHFDMEAGERFVRACGERHGRAKLTADQFVAIRADVGTIYGIAKRYGISRRQVQRIRNRAHWGHV